MRLLLDVCSLIVALQTLPTKRRALWEQLKLELLPQTASLLARLNVDDPFSDKRDITNVTPRPVKQSIPSEPLFDNMGPAPPPPLAELVPDVDPEIPLQYRSATPMDAKKLEELKKKYVQRPGGMMNALLDWDEAMTHNDSEF